MLGVFYSIALGIFFGIIMFLRRKRQILERLSHLQRTGSGGDNNNSESPFWDFEGRQSPMDEELTQKMKKENPELYDLWSELNELVTRDFIDFWYPVSVSVDEDFQNELKSAMHYMESKLVYRAKKVDWIYFIATSVLPTLRDILRIYINTERELALINPKFYTLSPDQQDENILEEIKEKYKLHVASGGTEEEVKYCRNISACVLEELLPPQIHECTVAKIFIREVCTNVILYPQMGFAEPYYINWLITMATGYTEDQDLEQPIDPQEEKLPAVVEDDELEREDSRMSDPRISAESFGSLRSFDAARKRSTLSCGSLTDNYIPENTSQRDLISPFSRTSDLVDEGKALTPALVALKCSHGGEVRKYSPPFETVTLLGGQNYNFKFKLSQATPLRFEWALRVPINGCADVVNVIDYSPKSSHTHDLKGATPTNSGGYYLIISASDQATSAWVEVERLLVEVQTKESFSSDSDTDEQQTRRYGVTRTSVFKKLNPVHGASKAYIAVSKVARRKPRKSDQRIERIHMLEGSKEKLQDWELKNPEIRFDQSTIQWDPKPYARYSLEVTDGEFRWRVYKRYSQIFQLHKRLVKSIDKLTTKCPRKQVFGNLEPKFIEARKKSLQSYMRSLCWSKQVIQCSYFREFLIPTKDYSIKNHVHEELGAGNTSLNEEIYEQSKAASTKATKKQTARSERIRRRDTERRLLKSNIMSGLTALGDTFLALERSRAIKESALNLAKLIPQLFHSRLTLKLLETAMSHTTIQNTCKLVQLIKDSLWPDGEWYTPQPLPTEKEKEAEKERALKALKGLVPDSVPQIAAQHVELCLVKLHRFIQLEPIMKHFLYTILDALTEELFIFFQKSRQRRQEKLQ